MLFSLVICEVYFSIHTEAMADAGVKMGLPRDLAYQLAAQTMVGSGQMVLKTGIHPAVLKVKSLLPLIFKEIP